MQSFNSLSLCRPRYSEFNALGVAFHLRCLWGREPTPSLVLTNVENVRPARSWQIRLKRSTGGTAEHSGAQRREEEKSKRNRRKSCSQKHTRTRSRNWTIQRVAVAIANATYDAALTPGPTETTGQQPSPPSTSTPRALTPHTSSLSTTPSA